MSHLRLDPTYDEWFNAVIVQPWVQNQFPHNDAELDALAAEHDEMMSVAVSEDDVHVVVDGKDVWVDWG